MFCMFIIILHQFAFVNTFFEKFEFFSYPHPIANILVHNELSKGADFTYENDCASAPPKPNVRPEYPKT